MRYGVAMMEAEEQGKLSQMMAELPGWAQSIISILIVVAIAAVAGMVIGKLYAMVKYPDPEKHSAVSPKIKVAFICLLALCCWWLFSTMMSENEPEEPAGGEEGIYAGVAAPDTMMGGAAGVMIAG